MSGVSENTKSHYRSPGRPKNALLKQSRFIASAFVIALGLMWLVFSGVSDSPTGMVVGNISESQAPENVEPYVSPEVIAKFNEQVAVCNKYLSEQDNNNSIDCLLKADSIKTEVQVLFALAELYSLEENYSVSANYYSRAIGIDPDDQISRYNYAIVFERLNQTDDALEQYSAAIEISANYTAPLNNMAILLQKLGRLNESKESFEKALLIEGNNSAIILNYANILAELGQNSMAEENYRKAIELSPDDKGAYRNFAQFLFNNNRLPEADEMLEKTY